MVSYGFSKTVAKATTEDNADTVSIRVGKGICRAVHLIIPPGCSGLVYVQMFYQNIQIFPVPRGTSVRGDGIQHEFTVEFPIYDEPRVIKMKIWNLDDTYSHTISGTITMEEERKGETSTIEKLVNVIEKMMLWK